jgi:hypothetical protein
LFGVGNAASGLVDGIAIWSASIVANLDPSIVPGSYTAYVYGDDAESLTNDPALKDDGYAKPDTGNFKYPTLTASLMVIKADQAITFAPLADKTYGDTDFDVNATASSGLTVTFAASGTCTIYGTTVHIAGAGDCAITASQSGDSNYNAAADVKRTFAIGKANATIEVIPYEVTFDGGPHTATGTAKGVFNEPLSGLDLSGTTHTSAGDYATDAWTFTDVTGNYQNATGTVRDKINKASATINVTPYNVTYDGAAHTATGTATGVGGVDLSGSLNLSGTTHTNAGIYNADPWTFTGGANYNDASGTVNDGINKANATIKVTPYSVTYDGAAHTATGTATGVGGVNLAAGLNFGATTHTNAGDYATDAWTFTDATGNYNNASGTVLDRIDRKTASVTPNAATKTYGDGDPPLSGVLSGFLPGDGVTATYGRYPGETVTSGPYAISALLSPAAVLSNYAVTYNTGVFTITQRALIVTADSKSKIAGGVNPALTGVIVGIQFGDGITASYSTTAVTLSPPGSYPITPAVNPDAKLGNYMVTAVAGTLIVSANAFPVLGTITGPVAPTPLGTPIQISVPFTDLDVLESQPYTATIDWGDLATSTTQFSSSGTITGSHTYAAGGVYVVSVTIKQNNFEDHQHTKTVEGYVVVYDPSAGFVTGGGWINSPPGAFYANPSLTGKANFGFVSKYQKGANVPTGNTEFQFQAGNFSFKSTSYEWLVISGGFKAQYKGTGTVNGKGSYGFMLTAIDGGAKGGGSPDTFRLKVWDANGSIYDNQLGASDISDPTTAVSGGSIVIHK